MSAPIRFVDLAAQQTRLRARSEAAIGRDQQQERIIAALLAFFDRPATCG